MLPQRGHVIEFLFAIELSPKECSSSWNPPALLSAQEMATKLRHNVEAEFLVARSDTGD